MRKIKILFFIGNLCYGGKERRLIELIAGLKNKSNVDILLVLAFNQIDYEYFFDIGIKFISIDKKPKSKSIKVFFQLNKIVREYKPNLIHTWGSMQTFYMIPIALMNQINLINSQITDAPPHIKKLSYKNFLNKINFRFSDINLSNSYAGLKAYGVSTSNKSRVIHNGFDFKRISNLTKPIDVRNHFQIKTKYVIGMVASFSEKKDYTTYIDSAISILSIRNDVTFLCVGAGNDKPFIRKIPETFRNKIKFLSRQEKVESIIRICDIGVLTSNPITHGEGISNAIMEFMALSKPVIASDNGGTSEIIKTNVTGFIIPNRSKQKLEEKVLVLLNNSDKRKEMGNAGIERIKNKFNIGNMVNSFLELYNHLST